MPITQPPQAPVPGSPEFALQTRAFLDWLHDSATEFNDAVGDANQAVEDAQSASGSADDAVLAAQQARNAAQGYASNAANSASAADTAKTGAETAKSGAETAKAGAEDARDAAHVFANAAGEATGLPAPLESMPLGSLRVNADGSGLEATYEAPAGDVKHIEITASAALAAAQKGALIDVSGTGITLTLDAAALGNGWWCYLRIVGSTSVTASAAAGQTIDGVASGVMKPGMTLLVQCDGANFHCVRVGPHVAMEILTSGTSWTTPLGVRVARFRLTNGGTPGRVGNGSLSGPGGRGGSTAEFISAITPGTAYTYAIGASNGTTQIVIDGSTFTGESIPGGRVGKIIEGFVYAVDNIGTTPQPGGQTVTGFGKGGDGARSAPATAGASGGIILEY